MGTLLALAWRNLWRHSRRTVITMSSIGLGLALSVLFFGLNDGGHTQMIRNGIKLGEGHLTVQPRGYQDAPANHLFLHEGRAVLEALAAADLPGRVAPRVELQVLASTAANSLGVSLIGLELARDPWMDQLRPKLVEGEWPAADDPRGLAIGADMARKLSAQVGSKVVVMTGTTSGDVEAQLGRVRAIFDSGLDQFDDFAVITRLDFARRFLAAEGGDPAKEPVTRVAVYLEGGEGVTDIWHQQLQGLSLPDGAAVLTWREVIPQLVTFIVLDDVGTFIWVGIIFVMVTFGILNTILMSVLERTREFGLLRALGMGSVRLLMLVLTETVMLAMASLALGWLIGGAAHWYFATHGLDLSALYPDGLEASGIVLDPVLISELRPDRIWFLSAFALAATVASGIYPAIKAARVPPVVALQT